MVLEEIVHLPPHGSRSLCAWLSHGNCSGRVGKAQGVVQGRAFRQGNGQSGIERVAGGGGVLHFDLKTREMRR